jgi:hypothetical protein
MFVKAIRCFCNEFFDNYFHRTKYTIVNVIVIIMYCKCVRLVINEKINASIKCKLSRR